MARAYGPVQEVNPGNGGNNKDKVKGGGSKVNKRKSNLVEELGEDYKWECSLAYYIQMKTVAVVLAIMLLLIYLCQWHQIFGDYSSNVSSFLAVASVKLIHDLFGYWSTALERKKLEKELNVTIINES